MSKTDYSKASSGLVERVTGVIEESRHHRYSVSRVYAAYNEVFSKQEKPQTCSSCLRNRVCELGKWLEGYNEYLAAQDAPAGGQPQENAYPVTDRENAEEARPTETDPNNPQLSEPAPGVVRTPMEEGLPIDFIPEAGDVAKGTVKYADGTNVKPGTYRTALGVWITVQVGGKARMYEDAAIKGENSVGGEEGAATKQGDAEEAGATANQDEGESLL